jgi:hypothetical protein
MLDSPLVPTAATLCYALYAYPDSPRVAWEHLDDGTGSNGVYWAAVRLNGVLWGVYRGSVTQLDWERDLYAFYDPFLHDQLGPIHPGFWKGIPGTVDTLLAMAKTGEPIGLAGHSLAAGRASLATGELCVRGRPPLTRIVFGEPHSGGSELAKITGPYLGPSFRNVKGPDADWEDMDQVTIVPPWFQTPGPRTDLTVTPNPNDPWGVFKYHRASLYAGAVGVTETWAY